jgi:hypothetical protein
MESKEIINAIERWRSVCDKDSSLRAYANLLDAVGNNHAGTYGPDAPQLVCSLKAVLETGSPWAQHTALEALIELGGSFRPDPASLVFDGAPLQSVVRKRISELKANVSSIAAGQSLGATSARTLMELIREIQA